MLTFSADNHEYRWNGDVKPSVTGIINDWLKVQVNGYFWYVHTSKGTAILADIFEAAGDHGTAVHLVFKLILSGMWVDKDILHPDLLPAMKEAERFKREDVEEIILLEEPLYSKKLDVCGTPDFFGRLRGWKHLVLLDFKSGDFSMVSVQLSAYEVMIREKTGYRGIISHACLHIPKKGEPRGPFEIKDRGALKEFQNRLSIYKRNKERE